MPKGRRIYITTDPEFYFLLTIDSAFESWRLLAAEWMDINNNSRSMGTILAAFFVRYIHEFKMDKEPVSIFETGRILPDLLTALDLTSVSESNRKLQHDKLSDFLEWVLRTHLSKADEEGHNIVPKNLRNPFPRIRAKKTGKGRDINFKHVLALDPRMCHWQSLATEWLSQKKKSVAFCREALDHFLVTYILECDLSRLPITFLTRSTPKPIFHEVLIKAKKNGFIGQLSSNDIVLNNYASEFIDWILSDKLSLEDEQGLPVIPHTLHNPVMRLTNAGRAVPSETVRSALSIRYIKELRSMLAEGQNFCDWHWAQQAMEGGNSGGDWFAVEPDLVDREDPDCVWRERDATSYERYILKRKGRITEMWSPVRAIALYLKLELPLRTFQVRMLDSGEADTWRYQHDTQGGHFILNDSRLATGSVKRPHQRGIFHRSINESGVGLFINTNKTADSGKAENAKGYVMPWENGVVLYWLTKLRNWQERYNAICAPSLWTELELKHFGNTPPHPQVLAARGTICFLFRDATAENREDRRKPICDSVVESLWYKLLVRLEHSCLARSETLDDGTPILFVNHNSPSATYYPLHALRVSLITYLVLDLQLPIAVVSKLIAGHSRLIMTIYYTKFGHAYMKEVLEAAERNMLDTEESNHRRFLMDATMEQVSQRFASVSVDAIRSTVGHQSAATFVFEDKGICPVGGSMCDVGGECVQERLRDPVYAPVPGYPERNCVRCRFFISGPAFLPGLQAHFNALSYEAHERAERYNELQEEVTRLEDQRADCELDGCPFTETRELEKLSQRFEEEALLMGKAINDLQATYHLIHRSLDIMKNASEESIQLVAVGNIVDVQMGFVEGVSEMHQLEVLCENAILYPEIDARKPSLRRAQLLDCMLEFNKIQPVFFRMSQKQQLETGNAVMKLIQARTGSLKKAVEFTECQRYLQEIGLVEATLDVLAEKTVGTPIRKILNTAQNSEQNGNGHAPR